MCRSAVATSGWPVTEVHLPEMAGEPDTDAQSCFGFARQIAEQSEQTRELLTYDSELSAASNSAGIAVVMPGRDSYT